MTPAIPTSETKTEIVEYFASILRVPVRQVRTDVHILELGVDSIMLIEAQRWLKGRFDCVIEAPRFFDDLNTLDRIAAFADTSRPGDAPPAAAGSLPRDGNALPDSLSRQIPSTAGARDAASLMRSQLATLSEVIEAQNRVLRTLHQNRAQPDV